MILEKVHYEFKIFFGYFPDVFGNPSFLTASKDFFGETWGVSCEMNFQLCFETNKTR